MRRELLLCMFLVGGNMTVVYIEETMASLFVCTLKGKFDHKRQLQNDSTWRYFPEITRDVDMPISALRKRILMIEG
jgi:hypothetical protein